MCGGRGHGTVTRDQLDTSTLYTMYITTECSIGVNFSISLLFGDFRFYLVFEVTCSFEKYEAFFDIKIELWKAP